MNRKERATERAGGHPEAHQNREAVPERGSGQSGRDVRKGSLKSFFDENRSLDTLALFTKLYARL